jgi:hypothetical protein
MRCDATRIVTFMLGDGASTRTYPSLGVPEAHHALSHHRGDPERLRKLTLIATWETSRLARLVEGLASLDGFDAPPLARTLILFSSELADGDTHTHTNLPVALIGGSGLGFRGGRFVGLRGDPPIARLFVSCLHAFGIPDPRFGADGDRPLTGLG